MRAVVQRVTRASVAVDGEVVASIGPGLLILLGVHREDDQATADWMAGKLARLRILDDEDGVMNRSLLETGGEALVISQFTLLANNRKGNRPSFNDAARPESADPALRAMRAVAGKTARQAGAHRRVRCVYGGRTQQRRTRSPS